MVSFLRWPYLELLPLDLEHLAPVLERRGEGADLRPPTVQQRRVARYTTQHQRQEDISLNRRGREHMLRSQRWSVCVHAASGLECGDSCLPMHMVCIQSIYITHIYE